MSCSFWIAPSASIVSKLLATEVGRTKFKYVVQETEKWKLLLFCGVRTKADAIFVLQVNALKDNPYYTQGVKTLKGLLKYQAQCIEYLEMFRVEFDTETLNDIDYPLPLQSLFKNINRLLNMCYESIKPNTILRDFSPLVPAKSIVLSDTEEGVCYLIFITNKAATKARKPNNTKKKPLKFVEGVCPVCGNGLFENEKCMLCGVTYAPDAINYNTEYQSWKLMARAITVYTNELC